MFVGISYGQLKSAFDRTATLGERARKFRENRVEIIRQRKTWRPLVGGPMCAVHFVPITAMAGNAGVDIAALYNDYHDFMLAGWRSGSRTTNLDGLVVHPVSDHGSTPGYTQVFRTGAFEAARAGGGLIDPSQKTIPSTTVSNFYRDAVGRFLGASRKLGLSGPAIVGIALLEVAGHKWAYRNDFPSTASADRNDLVLPEVWVEQLDATNNVDEIARPLLEILWQAFGIEECLLYDKNGQWTPR